MPTGTTCTFLKPHLVNRFWEFRSFTTTAAICCKYSIVLELGRTLGEADKEYTTGLVKDFKMEQMAITQNLIPILHSVYFGTFNIKKKSLSVSVPLPKVELRGPDPLHQLHYDRV